LVPRLIYFYSVFLALLIIILLIFTFSRLGLGLLILAMAGLLSKKASIREERTDPFECGFVPQRKSRSPFSLHFFIVTILFLIFDVELVILFPFLTLPIESRPNIAIILAAVGALTLGTLLE